MCYCNRRDILPIVTSEPIRPSFEGNLCTKVGHIELASIKVINAGL